MARGGTRAIPGMTGKARRAVRRGGGANFGFAARCETAPCRGPMRQAAGRNEVANRSRHSRGITGAAPG